MKKIIFNIAFIAITNGAYGMEAVPTVKMFTHEKFPHITVVLDDVYNRRTKNADVTVFGESEQIRLKKPGLVSSPFVGCMSFSIDNCIMKKNKVFAKHFDSYGFDDDSAEIIVDGELFTIKDVDSHIEHKKMDSKLIFIREPQLFLDESSKDDLPYIYKKTANRPEVKKYSSMLETVKYTGYKAIEEAFSDLGDCYTLGLDYVPQMFAKEFVVKSIAFAQLSKGLGLAAYKAAKVAVESVVKFVTDDNHKDTYDLIELVVAQPEDYNLYKIFLNECAKAKDESS